MPKKSTKTLTKEPVNTVSNQFSKEVIGSYYKNLDGNLYQLRIKPITTNQHEPRIRYLQNCNDPHITIEITYLIDWEVLARP